MFKDFSKISVRLFIIVNTFYEFCDNPSSVPLAIIYFSGLYFTLILICLYNYYLTESKKELAIGFAFFIRLIWENTKWPMTMDEYIVSVNNYEKSVLIAILTITVLISTIHHERK